MELINAIVTIKLTKNKLHNPNEKKTGKCPIHNNIFCTDTTGQHHSMLVEGKDIEDITRKVKENFSHITRIEILRKRS